MLANPTKLKRGTYVAVYIRVSSRGQAKDGNGADVQEKICREIISRNGWKLYQIYFNPKGVSGEIEPKDRPEFMDMIKDGSEGKFLAVVVNSLDRLGRSNLNIELAKKMIWKNNLKLFANNTFVEDTLDGHLDSGIKQVLAAYEKGNLVLRMNRGLDVARKERGVTQGKLPFGYKKSGKGKNTKIIINDYEAKTLNIIYEKRKNNETLQSIADYLNSIEIKPPRSNKWDHKKVGQLLTWGKRDMYTGGLRNGGNKQGICWPQILPDSYKITKEEIEMYENLNFKKSSNEENEIVGLKEEYNELEYPRLESNQKIMKFQEKEMLKEKREKTKNKISELTPM